MRHSRFVSHVSKRGRFTHENFLVVHGHQDDNARLVCYVQLEIKPYYKCKLLEVITAFIQVSLGGRRPINVEAMYMSRKVRKWRK